MLVNRRRMAQILAWSRGAALFDDVLLFEAAAEMNRYSATPTRVVGPDGLDRLRVSGMFRIGDFASFADAMAALHGLVVRERPDGLELMAR